MGITDRKKSINIPISTNLDLNQEPTSNAFIVQNNVKGGGFVDRKKSGNVFAGSKLNVPGQGIYNEKNVTPDLFKKLLLSPTKDGGTPIACDFTYIIRSIPNAPTPTPTPTQTNTVIPTQTPTPTPTPTTEILSYLNIVDVFYCGDCVNSFAILAVWNEYLLPINKWYYLNLGGLGEVLFYIAEVGTPSFTIMPQYFILPNSGVDNCVDVICPSPTPTPTNTPTPSITPTPTPTPF
jgi:hypothetical protein